MSSPVIEVFSKISDCPSVAPRTATFTLGDASRAPKHSAQVRQELIGPRQPTGPAQCLHRTNGLGLKQTCFSHIAIQLPTPPQVVSTSIIRYRHLSQQGLTQRESSELSCYAYRRPMTPEVHGCGRSVTATCRPSAAPQVRAAGLTALPCFREWQSDRADRQIRTSPWLSYCGVRRKISSGAHPAHRIVRHPRTGVGSIMPRSL